jgi:hypothetical protein
MLLKTASELSDLGAGRMAVDGWLAQLKAIEVLRRLRSEYFAIALARLNSFWFRGVGQLYQRESILTSQRGISCTRVFVLDDRSTVLDSAFSELIDKQAAAGIITLIAYASELERDLIVDLGLFDNELVVYYMYPAQDDVIAGSVFTTTEAELLKARQLRDRILQWAIPWETVREQHC